MNIKIKGIVCIRVKDNPPIICFWQREDTVGVKGTWKMCLFIEHLSVDYGSQTRFSLS